MTYTKENEARQVGRGNHVPSALHPLRTKGGLPTWAGRDGCGRS